MLTPRQYAKLRKVAYTTVMSWLRQDLIPGAVTQTVANKNYYEIPSDAPRPAIKAGRPSKKAKEDEKDGN